MTKEGETRIKDGYMQQLLRNKLTPGRRWRTIGKAPEKFNLGNWAPRTAEKHIIFHPPNRHREAAYHNKMKKTYRKKTAHKKSKIMKKKKPSPININARGEGGKTRRTRKKTRRRTKRRKRNYAK
jgi:hypothetical protein